MTVACGSAAGLPQSAATPPAQTRSAAPPSTQPATPRPASRAATSPASTGSGSESASKPLAGKVVGIDPGHNGDNGADPAYINQMIWNGRESETCDTTGTQTASGYTEA